MTGAGDDDPGSTTRAGIVEVPYRGRLGNRLSEYCVGRSLAEQLGFGLAVQPLPGFPGVGPIEPPGGAGTAVVAGDLSSDRVLTLKGHRLDVQAVRAEVAARQIQCVQVHGHFHRYELFRPHKQAIRQSWLASAQPIQPSPPDVLTIHVRSGDIWQRPDGGAVHPEYPALPFSFYAKIVAHRPWAGVLVVTEDPDDPMVRKLAVSFAAEVRSGSVLADFNLLRASSNLVLSVSSFAWWAAWLSDAARVFFPVAGLFDPDRARRRSFAWQQDLWVDDEPRYVAIRPPDLDGDWAGTEQDRQRLLAEPFRR